MLDPTRIETRYARSGELNIAFQVFGQGPLDLVLIPGWASNVEGLWTLVEFAEFAGKLAQFARVAILDRRGTGLSDPVADPPTLEERMDDVRAVLDAAGWARAVIWGISEGGPMAAMFAATYPDRTAALVLYGTYARFSRGDDYPHGYPPETNRRWLATIESSWGSGEMSRAFVPGHMADESLLRQLARLERQAMSPGTARKLFTLLTQVDVRHVLPSVRVPTLVLHRVGDQPVRVGHARYLAEHIAGSRLIELAGDAHLPWLGDTGTLLGHVREFLTGERESIDVDRVLATVLFCDIVDSTHHAAQRGDHVWSALLGRFYAIVDDKLRYFRGRKLDTAGDGVFAAFDGPARAARCALALIDAVRPLGLQLRVGVHTGECEVLGHKYGGIAVHLGARVAAAAQPGQALVTSTVKDLVVGSGLHFDDLGEQVLKGLADRWRLFRVVG